MVLGKMKTQAESGRSSESTNMKEPYARVKQFVSKQVWAIRESTLDTIVEVLRMRSAGISLSKEEIQARVGTGERPQADTRGSVGVLPLYGCIAPKMNMMVEISGGTSLDQYMAQFRAFRDDHSVTAVLTDIDSPGGSVYMLRESFDEIYAARTVKPMIAVVNPTCCSAAYYIASAFQEIVCTPSGEVGSIGTVMVHGDFSAANEMEGYKPTYIHYGKFKVEGNEDFPLEDEAHAYLKSLVDEYGQDFEKAIAKARGKSVSEIRADFGQGRVFLAKHAMEVGMIDRIDSFDAVLSKLVGRRSRPIAARAAVADLPIGAETSGPIDEVHEHATREVFDKLAAGKKPETPEEAPPAMMLAEDPPSEPAAPAFPYERESLVRELELLEKL